MGFVLLARRVTRGSVKTYPCRPTRPGSISHARAGRAAAAPPLGPTLLVCVTVALFWTCPGWAQTSTAAAASVTPPAVLTHVDAEYPRAALAARRHADVVVRVTVDVDGHVSQVDIAESGGAELDEAAVVAVRQWTFTPALRAGKPVKQPHSHPVPLRATGASSGGGGHLEA